MVSHSIYISVWLISLTTIPSKSICVCKWQHFILFLWLNSILLYTVECYIYTYICVYIYSVFPGGSAGNESACIMWDLGSIPGLGRCPGGGKGYPLQYSGLENSMDCIVHGVAKSEAQLGDFHFHFHFHSVFFIRSPVDGHLGWFHVLAIIHNACMNIGVCVLFWISAPFFFRYVSRSRITESYGSCIFSFMRNLHVLSIVSILVYIPTISTQGSFSPHILEKRFLVSSCLFDDYHADRCEAVFHCGSDLCFPDKGCWAYFHVSVGHCMSSLQNTLHFLKCKNSAMCCSWTYAYEEKELQMCNFQMSKLKLMGKRGHGPS